MVMGREDSMIDVKDNQDGSFTIYWDENDEMESMLNTWKEEDFIQAIREGFEKRKEK